MWTNEQKMFVLRQRNASFMELVERMVKAPTLAKGEVSRLDVATGQSVVRMADGGVKEEV